MKTIDPKLVTLSQLLDGRLFRIPEYQRAYSWSSRERDAMFGDLDALLDGDDDRTHFMATVVVLERGRQVITAEEFAVVEVVDGQQRLTTVVLLLRALERALSDKKPDHKKLRSKLSELLVKDDDVSLLLLQTNHDTSHVFRDYVRDGTHPDPDATPGTLSERSLRDAIGECEAWLAAKGAAALVPIATMLLNRLTFIVHTLTDEATVYTVFEVLNSRGLSVAWIDRLKSMLMAIAFEAGDPSGEHLAELHQGWREVYLELGLREGMSDEALRFAAVLLTGELNKGRLLSSEDAALAVRAWCGGSTKKAIKASRWLGQVVRAMNSLYEQPERTALVNVSQARFVAVAIELSPMPDQGKRRCLDRWERTVFRVFGIAGKDARTLSGQLVHLGLGIHGGAVGAKAAVDQLRAMASDKSYGTIRDQLEDENCYSGWTGFLRYLLYRYEQHLAHEAGETVDATTWTRIWAARTDDTIEHVIPQSEADGDGYVGKVFVHRLGNLLVLPPKQNSKLGKKPFSEKRKRYLDSPLRHVREVGEIEKWNLAAIREREERILTWVEEEFGP